MFKNNLFIIVFFALTVFFLLSFEEKKENSPYENYIYYSEQLRLNPSDMMNRLAKAYYLMQLDRDDEALQELNIVDMTSDDPDKNFEADKFRSYILFFKKGENDAAENVYNRMVETYNRKEAFYLRGNFYLYTYRFEEAEKDFGQALKFDDKYLEALILMGYTECILGKDGFPWFSKALEIDKNNILLYTYRLEVFLLRRQYNRALYDAGKIGEIDKDAEYRWKGHIYFARGDFENAWNNYHKCSFSGETSNNIFFLEALQTLSGILAGKLNPESLQEKSWIIENILSDMEFDDFYFDYTRRRELPIQDIISDVNFYFGCKMLIEHKKDEAAEHFKNCVAAGRIFSAEYQIAIGFTGNSEE